jgi:uncharacterized protein (TIGR02145 family)
MKNRKTNFIIMMISSVLCFTACNNVKNDRNDHSTINEEDISSEQLTVKIGNQEWASENLNVSTFRNGDAIPEAQTSEAWFKAGEEGKPAWCYSENDPENGNKYGRLYNWYAVNDARGLAPSGWHIPSDAEWTTLTDNLGGEYEAGHKMKSQAGWDDNGNGSNASGFSGLPGGSRYFNETLGNGTFDDIGYYTYWWSSTEYDTYHAWNRDLCCSLDYLNRNNLLKRDGFSVRCLRD